MAKHAPTPVSAEQVGVTTGRSATPPVVSADYTANVERYTTAKAGMVTETETDFCCEPDALGQCQVLLIHSKGATYHDFTNQRVRTEDEISGKTIVDDLHNHVAMVVNLTNGVETCQEWCPINPADRVANFTPWVDRKGPFVDVGATTVHGHAAEHYSWKEGLVLLGVYTKYDFFAAKNGTGAAATPLLLTESVNMLGRIGEQTNITYSGFTAGAPPESKFKIAHGPADGCPQSSCNSAAWQAHRLAARQTATHAMFA